MRQRLEGQTAWISGAGSGIGAAAARLLAEEGANVAVVDVDVARSDAVCDQIVSAGGQALSVPADVAVEAEVRDSITATVARFGGLSIVVNAAGIVHVSALHEYEERDWDRLMGVNVKGIFLALKHGLPNLRRHPRSYVVNVGSISSFVGQALTPAYTTSKAAVLGLNALDRARLRRARPPVQLRLPWHHRHSHAPRASEQDARPRGNAGAKACAACRWGPR